MKKNKLHKLAPLLSKITLKNSAFEIPENYFDSVNDVIIAKLKAEALQNNKNDTIPKPYFDSIEDVVLNKIKSKSRVFSLKNNIIKYAAPLAIAASLLFLIILNNSNNTITFDSIATSDIEASIEDGLIDIDAENLATIFSDIELDDSDLMASLSDDEVLDYLSNEDLDEIMYEN